MTKSVKKAMMCVAILSLAGLSSAAYTEGWDAFGTGDPNIPFTPASSNGWEVKAGTPSTNPYVGDANDFGDGAFFALDGLTLRSASSNDYEIRNVETGVPFGLTEAAITDAGGIRASFNYNATYAPAASSIYRTMMLLREGAVRNSPHFGIEWDASQSSPAWTLRAPDGTRFYGNAVDVSKSLIADPIGGSATGIRETWLNIIMDYDGQFATLSVDYEAGGAIDTGLTGVDLSTANPADPNNTMSAAEMAALNRFQVRTGGTSKSYLDNLSVDVIPSFGYSVDFESPFTVGALPQNDAYGNEWESKQGFSAIGATSTSGEYVGGQAIVATAVTDCETRHTSGTGWNLAMTDSVEIGFDIINAGTRGVMNVRGASPNSSAVFGIYSGKWAVRTGANASGAYVYGNDVSGLWNHWIRVSMILSGPNFEYATIKAYDLTDSVEIETGLSYVDTLNPKTAGDFLSLDRMQVRLTGSSSVAVDNMYIMDTVTDPVAFNPSPADKAYPVATSGVTLSWTSDPTIDSHKVYFGTDPEALTLETEIFAPAATSYALPYTLDLGTTYYWRVDEIQGATTYTGIAWEFTTLIDSLDYPRNLAYDGFDYPAFVVLGSSAGGYGWATDWQRAGGTWCYVKPFSGSLVPVSGYIHSTIGNKLTYDGSAPGGAANSDAVRELAYPIDLRADQDYFISFLVSEELVSFNRADFGLFETKGGSHLFKFHMLPLGWGQSPDVPVFALRDNDGVWNTRTFGAPVDNTDYTVVVKIAASQTGDDTVLVKVYSDPDVLPAAEPIVWDASFTLQSNGVYPWVSLDSKGDSFDQTSFDEVRVGLGWGAVTGNAEACGDLGTVQYYDLDENCYINLGDFALLASAWLGCTDPAGVGCENVSEGFGDLIQLTDTDLKVYETTTAITVDGDLSDWSGTWYNTRFTGGYQSANADDITNAEIALRWDQSTPYVVYMALKVTDTEHNFMDNPTTWNQGDFFEFAFTVQNNSTSTTWWDSWTFDTAQFYGLWPQTDGSTFGVLGNVHNTPGYTDPATVGVDYATAEVGDVIVYEMALPTNDPNSAPLVHGEVVAVNPQINSVSSAGFGALFDNQGKVPATDFFKFTVTANSTLSLGDFGYFDADLDLDGYVDIDDLLTIVQKWLSCTDPEVLGCDTPWAP